jgi:hypothetical protein
MKLRKKHPIGFLNGLNKKFQGFVIFQRIYRVKGHQACMGWKLFERLQAKFLINLMPMRLYLTQNMYLE